MIMPLIITALLSLAALIGLTLLVVIFNRKKHPTLKGRSLKDTPTGLQMSSLYTPPLAITPPSPAMKQTTTPQKPSPSPLPRAQQPSTLPVYGPIAICNEGLSSEEAPKLTICRGLSPAYLPTFNILFIQSTLMQLIINREHSSILRLIDYIKTLSRTDQIRILGRRYSSRERTQDPLPIIGQLDHYPQCALAQEIKRRIEELCDVDKRLGSELIITLKEINPNQIPTITSWLSYSLMGASAIDFIRMNDSNSHTSDLEKAQAVICTMLTELLQLFDQDQSIQRGSFTFTGRDGQVLKQIFDAIVRIEHDLTESQPVNDTTVPAASALAGTARGLAQLLTSYISPPKTTYNRSALGASSHYRGCQQFGIDFLPGMLPMGKQHILFGFTQSGDFWLKLEEHGLGNMHDIALHGLGYVASRLSPPPDEPRYSS